MKRLLTLSLLLLSAFAFGATTTPVQLLNPSGSTAGQAIISTGPTSAPAWGTVTLGGVSGTLAVANGGTGATTQSAALANLLGSSVIGVANGGTGAASLAAHGVIVGEGAAAFTSIGPGTNGQMLLGVTSADPYWGNNPAISGGTVDNSPIGNTTASSGKFTTLNATGLITPSATAGIKGTATNDNANAGSVGEYVTNTTSGTSLTTATANTCTSASLTAGDWDVQSIVLFTPGSTTSITSLYSGVSTVAGTAGSLGQYTKVGTPGQVPNNTSVITSPVVRVSIASTTTVYAIGRGDFTVSTLTCDGFIRARRVR